MTVHEEYVAVISERYGQIKNESYEMGGYYSCVSLAPEQYKVEASMLAFVKNHPDASLKEVCDYFGEITPVGLAPGDDGADLWED
ncbi:MAG: hypothetical protein LUE21_02315 [Oscillospiraceae bacterium]|nr:hypothetical protein [Oscillospiraceae bacterium]